MSYKKPGPAAATPAMSVARQGRELSVWKTGYLAGWVAACEYVDGLGVREKVATAMAATLRPLTAWRDDAERAMPPVFGSGDHLA